MDRLSIGLVGVANHGTTILNAILESGNLQLAGCFDIDPEATRNAAERTGARHCTTYGELLADRAVQAIVLVTPNHVHYEQVVSAVAAKKHVFVEKPIARTTAEGRAMIDLTRSAGLVLMVGHNTRRRRVFRRSRRLLDEGRIGKIVAVEGNISGPAGLQPGLPSWKADPGKCPLLPMTQLGIHLIDTVEYLLGHVARVSCVAANIAMPGLVYDSCAAVMQLESGIPFTLTSYYVSPEAFFLRVFGTRGTLHCYPTSLEIEAIREGKETDRTDEQFSDEGSRSYVEQMREFGECVLNGRVPETDGEVGVRALAVVEAMMLSVDSAAAVDLKTFLR